MLFILSAIQLINKSRDSSLYLQIAIERKHTYKANFSEPF